MRRKKSNTEGWIQDRGNQKQVLATASRQFTISAILEELGIELTGNFDQLLEFCQLVKGRFAALDELAEAISDAGDILKWKPEDFLSAKAENRPVELDEIIDWRRLNRVEIAAAVAAAGCMTGIETAKAVLGANLAEVVRAAVRNATEGEGGTAQADRRLLVEVAGMLPKGPSTVVNVNQQNNTLQMGLPAWDETRKVVDAVYFGKQEKEPKGLPEAKLEEAIVIDGEVIEESVYVGNSLSQ